MKNRIMGMFILFILGPIITFAHGFGEGGWGNHMGFMGTGWSNHMGFMGGGWMMILWIGLLILAIIAMIRWVITPKNNLVVANNAQSILAERYAKGEITQEEFMKMKKQLN